MNSSRKTLGKGKFYKKNPNLYARPLYVDRDSHRRRVVKFLESSGKRRVAHGLQELQDGRLPKLFGMEDLQKKAIGRISDETKLLERILIGSYTEGFSGHDYFGYMTGVGRDILEVLSGRVEKIQDQHALAIVAIFSDDAADRQAALNLIRDPECLVAVAVDSHYPDTSSEALGIVSKDETMLTKFIIYEAGERGMPYLDGLSRENLEQIGLGAEGLPGERATQILSDSPASLRKIANSRIGRYSQRTVIYDRMNLAMDLLLDIGGENNLHFIINSYGYPTLGRSKSAIKKLAENVACLEDRKSLYLVLAFSGDEAAKRSAAERLSELNLSNEPKDALKFIVGHYKHLNYRTIRAAAIRQLSQVVGDLEDNGCLRVVASLSENEGSRRVARDKLGTIGTALAIVLYPNLY